MRIRLVADKWYSTGNLANPGCDSGFDFTLDAGDMKEIKKLDTGESLFFSHYNPETVECGD